MAGGVLILVAGPSGAGKDSLIAAARRHLADDPHFVFPRRIVTRADLRGEDHEPVTFEEFFRAREQGAFFLAWEAHGLGYGVPRSVLDDLEQGRSVIVNVSRRAVADCRRRWLRVAVISVSVEPAILRQRLLMRGRESAAEIENRVRRATDPACEVAPPFHAFDNSADLADTSARFIALVLSLAGRARQPKKTARHSA